MNHQKYISNGSISYMYIVKVLCGVKGSGPDPVLRKQMVLKNRWVLGII